MTKSAKRIEWEARIQEWKESGLSKAKWCRENGYKEHQLYYWLEKMDKPDSDNIQMMANANFLPVEVTDERNDPKGSIFIHINHVSVDRKSTRLNSSHVTISYA